MEPLVSESYFVASALVVTVTGKSLVAFLLYKQGKTRFWTSHFLKNGLSREKAFEEWKRVQNLLDNLVNLSYIVLFWRMFQWPKWSLFILYRWSYLCGLLFGLILIGISYWSTTECYNALGDHGKHAKKRLQKKS